MFLKICCCRFFHTLFDYLQQDEFFFHILLFRKNYLNIFGTNQQHNSKKRHLYETGHSTKLNFLYWYLMPLSATVHSWHYGSYYSLVLLTVYFAQTWVEPPFVVAEMASSATVQWLWLRVKLPSSAALPSGTA